MPLRTVKPAARPFDRGLRLGVHRFRCGADGAVVVAAHRHGAALDEAHYLRNGPFRIGAVPDVIAEQDHPLGAARLRKIETRAERLPVGVDIRKDGEPHTLLRSNPIGQACAGFDGYQTTGRPRRAISLEAGNGARRRSSRPSAIGGSDRMGK
jgi:hypothetical protein